MYEKKTAVTSVKPASGQEELVSETQVDSPCKLSSEMRRREEEESVGFGWGRKGKEGIFPAD